MGSGTPPLPHLELGCTDQQHLVQQPILTTPSISSSPQNQSVYNRPPPDNSSAVWQPPLRRRLVFSGELQDKIRKRVRDVTEEEHSSIDGNRQLRLQQIESYYKIMVLSASACFSNEEFSLTTENLLPDSLFRDHDGPMSGLHHLKSVQEMIFHHAPRTTESSDSNGALPMRGDESD